MVLNSNKIYYTYKDVTILPSVLSSIEHRSECSTHCENGLLPLFTSPMDTVVNEKNYSLFYNQSIIPILPRTIDINKRLEKSVNGAWAAYSLKEFERVFCNGDKLIYSDNILVLIDVANGHMERIIELVKIAKKIYGEKIVIMAGNIANPQTYIKYAEAGIDYCRCGIGGGNCCITATQLGVFCPMATLINDIYKIKLELIEKGQFTKLPKIVADGGVRNYDDIIKALALGADFVMCGSIFARALESAADKKCKNNSEVFLLENYKNLKFQNGRWSGEYSDEAISELGREDLKGKQIDLGRISATYYGMASQQGQIALNGRKTKTSEGNMKIFDVTYTIHGWSTNFNDYLRSAMSYIGCRSLKEIAENANVIINSKNASESINK